MQRFLALAVVAATVGATTASVHGSGTLGSSNSSSKSNSGNNDGVKNTTNSENGKPFCPVEEMTLVDTFAINGTAWAACEDLQRPDGAIVLVPSSGELQWFSKGYVQNSLEGRPHSNCWGLLSHYHTHLIRINDSTLIYIYIHCSCGGARVHMNAVHTRNSVSLSFAAEWGFVPLF